LYLTFKLLKRRYASHESDANLRELEYFNHPYDKGSSIRLVPDIDMDEPISLTSLSSQFVPAEVLNGGRGKKNAVQRKSTDEDDEDFLLEPGDFEPFEFGKKASGF
jgi:hypothetical protein